MFARFHASRVSILAALWEPTGQVVIIDGLHQNDETKAIDRLRVIDPAAPDQQPYWIDVPKGGYLDGVSFAVSIWNI
jgi:hypothetical protein